MDIKTAAKRTGIAALVAMSVLLTGCYDDGRPGHNSDRHHHHHHDGDDHRDGDGHDHHD